MVAFGERTFRFDDISFVNYYQILGVYQDADAKEIRKAYIRLVREIHPDKQSNEEDKKKATEITAQLNNIRDVLDDAKKRRNYDELLRKTEKTFKKEESDWTKAQPPPPNRNTNTSSNRSDSSQDDNRKSQSHSQSRSQSKSYQEGFGSSQNGDHQNQQSHYKQNENEAPPRRSRGETNYGNSSNRYYTDSGFSGFQQNSSSHGNPNAQENQHSSYGTEYSHHRRGEYKDPFSSKSSNFYSGNASKSEHKQSSSSHRRSSRKNKPSTSHGTSTQHNHQTYHRASNTGPKKSKYSPKTFGITKDGYPCQNCIRQQRYCHQHTNQDPINRQKKNGHGHGHGHGHGSGQKHSSNVHPQKTHTSSSSRGKVFGYTQKGESCKRCIQQGWYCYQHLDQAPSSNARARASTKSKGAKQSSSQPRGHNHFSGQGKVYGITQKGLPCERCRNQGRFCYQHKTQEGRRGHPM